MALHGDKQFDLTTRVSAIIDNLLQSKAHYPVKIIMDRHLGEGLPKTVLHANVELELTSQTC